MFQMSFVSKKVSQWYWYRRNIDANLSLLTSFPSSFLQKILDRKDGLSGESKSMLSSESESSNGSNAAFPASLIARM
jgi:hypothetical protein